MAPSKALWPIRALSKRRLLAVGALVFISTIALYLTGRVRMLEGAVVQVGLIPVRVEEEFASDVRMRHLVLAASQGRVTEVETLVASGVDVNWPGDFYRLTPLMWTTMHGSAAGVLKLLTLGADPNLRVSEVTEDHERRTLGTLPTDHAGQVRHGRLKIQLDAFGGESAISFALHKNRLDLLELLLKSGGDPNIRGRIDPVFFDAIEKVPGQVNPALRLMLDHGANPDLTALPDGRGASAVDWFTLSGNIASAIYLIERGANPARTVPWNMPGMHLPKEQLTEENSVEWNHAAAVVQRYLPDTPDRESNLYRLKHLMESHGVRFPVYDPNRSLPIEEERSMRLFDILKYRHMSDSDIERAIDYHSAQGTLHLIGNLPQDFKRYREATAPRED